MANNFIQPGHVMDYTNIGTTDIASGGVVAFADGIGVAQVNIPVGETGSVSTTGVWELPKAVGETLTQGEVATWTIDKVAGTGGVPAGRVWETAPAAATTVLVKIG